jgi:hypothetical protein
MSGLCDKSQLKLKILAQSQPPDHPARPNTKYAKFANYREARLGKKY